MESNQIGHFSTDATSTKQAIKIEMTSDRGEKNNQRNEWLARFIN